MNEPERIVEQRPAPEHETHHRSGAGGEHPAGTRSKNAASRKKRRARKKARTAKQLVLMIVLLAVLGACAYGALTFYGRTSALKTQNQARVDAAQQQLDEQTAAYAAIDPSTDEGAAHQLEAEQKAIEDAQQQAAALEEENASLQESIETLKTQVDELENSEDNAYYLAVYESMQKGMAIVEEYIEGN